MNKVYIEKSMEDCLMEALKNNAIITSDGLSDSEFIFVHNRKFYYEDGCCLGHYSETCEFLDSQKWTHEHKWFIIGYLSITQVSKIKELFKKSNGYTCDFNLEELNKIIESD